MRWIYHLARDAPQGEAPYAPPSLASEGFVHGSYKDAVRESARLYFADAAPPVVLQIDPRRLGVPLEVADTPRGPMPHVRGPVARDAIRAVLPLDEIDQAPDAVSGTRVAFVAFAGMTLLDLVGMHDPLSRVRTMKIDPTFSCEIVAAVDGCVWSDDGARVEAARVRPPLDEFDLVCVAGGLATRSLCHDATLVSWLAAFPANRTMASVCTGALLLGAAGRLRGRRATTHASARELLAAYGATATDARVVADGASVTAGGVTAGIDLGLFLAEWLAGADAARRIAAQMEHPWTGARALGPSAG